MSALRVAVADDSVLLREGLVRVLRDAGVEVVGAYGDAEALLAAVPELQLDAVVLDVRMPPTFRDEGVRAAIELRRRHPAVAILLLSQYVEVAYAQ
ncbi:MAG: response regulator transcription factor, partial [Microbacteriaceae bacterium]|nr:response regulator transcription factor [Microbacteriaceae bacterium]